MHLGSQITLAEARKEGKLDRFIAERDTDAGDQDAFDATLKALAGTWKSAQGTSKPGRSGD